MHPVHPSRVSLENWGQQVLQHAPFKFDERRLANWAYQHYSQSSPHPGGQAMNRRQQRQFLTRLETIHQHYTPNLSIYSQSDDRQVVKRSPRQFLHDVGDQRARHTFSYRFTPHPQRPPSATGHSSRLSLNIDPQQSRQVASTLAQHLDDPLHFPTLRSLKMMGPARTGQRTDDAVLYLRGRHPHQATQLAQSLKHTLGRGAFVEHTPPGMERVAKGISYAEIHQGHSTSFGRSRSAIIAKAVASYRKHSFLNWGFTFSDVLSYKLRKHGYDPDQPSRVATPLSRNVPRPYKHGIPGALRGAVYSIRKKWS